MVFSAGGRGVQAACVGALGFAAQACGTKNSYFIEQHIVVVAPDAGGEVVAPPGAPAASAPGSGDPPVDAPRPPLEGPAEELSPLSDDSDAGLPVITGAPTPDVEASALVVDVFGTLGNHYWFAASEEQVERMNAPYLGNGGFFYGDMYSPHGEPDVTFVDHLFVTAAGEAPHTADFGKVQVRLVGQSTGRPWTDESLPNFKLDADEFVDGNRIGGVKHLRLNNAVVGSIFREKLALDLYRALDYPAPRTAYAWVSGSVWGAGVDVPYIAVESYKPAFCKAREAELGGGCVNMWEFYGDIGQGILGFPESCQFSECEPTRGLEFEEAVAATPFGDGYQAALSDWLDWGAFHRFQCLSWILQTGDDALHNLNNFVLVERADGKFQHLPYSVDISLGQDWYAEVSLGGASTLALGCQSDAECWADTIATCEVLVDEFAAADPVGKLDTLHAELEQAGMLRPGDEARYKSLRQHIEGRLLDLPVELEDNRDAPSFSYCPYPLFQCGESCVAFPEECVLCPAEPPGEEPAPEPGADAGAEPPPGDEGACVPLIDIYGQPIAF